MDSSVDSVCVSFFPYLFDQSHEIFEVGMGTEGGVWVKGGFNLGNDGMGWNLRISFTVMSLGFYGR